jgi:hypothetical protein
MALTFDFDIHAFLSLVNWTFLLETLTFFLWVVLEYPSLITSHWLGSLHSHAKMSDNFYFPFIFCFVIKIMSTILAQTLCLDLWLKSFSMSMLFYSTVFQIVSI